jgi:sialic acid synthase SpsE
MLQIIVEIGLNHLGSEERAQRMLNGLLEVSSIDAVTFQIREDGFYKPNDPARRRLSKGFYRQAVKATHEKGRRLGIAICEESDIAPFASMGVDFWKVLSWNFKNSSLTTALQATGKTVYLSTGLSAMPDILQVSEYSRNAVLIHTQLSEKIEDVNLKAIRTIRDETGLAVAFGLHSACLDVMKTAIGFEPQSIFFYVKEEGCSGLFDDEHAVPMSRVRETVTVLKDLTLALGTGEKDAMEKPTWVV